MPKERKQISAEEVSKMNYSVIVDFDTDSKTYFDIDDKTFKIGCLQRIADSTEVIAKGFAALLSENEQLKKDKEWYKNDRSMRIESYSHLERSNAALRSQITKLKKKINETK